MCALALVTLIVREYAEAMAFYVDLLGFRLIEDTPLDNGKRWVVVDSPGSAGATDLLLARAANPQPAQSR